MQIALAAKLLANAKHAVVLTGAGISTPSGIPDFRSSKNGLWQKHNPMEVASLSTFRVHPERFFEWFRPLTKLIFEATPNAAHYAVSELEEKGIIKSVITQNVDGLHQRAGSENVLEVHGTLYTMTCGSCYTKHQTSDFVKEFLEHGTIPRCHNCGSILKPDAILFEEQLPKKVWQKVENQIKKSDLMLVVGSSLEVIPVANLPYKTKSSGGKLIIINNQPTYIDSRADAVFHQDAAQTLPAIVEEIINE